MALRVLLLSRQHDVVEQVVEQTNRLWSSSAVLVEPPHLDALAGAAQLQFDLVIADLAMSDPATDAICQHLRAHHYGLLLVVSAETTSAARVAAFELGADQYLTKPFAPEELRARLNALARRVPKSQASPLDADARPPTEAVSPRITLLDETREAWIDGRRARLSPTEFHLLRELTRHAGLAASHRDLLRRVWGPDAEDKVGYLKVYVQRLRRKLGDSAAHPQLIQSDRGVGYRFGHPESEQAQLTRAV